MKNAETDASRRIHSVRIRLVAVLLFVARLSLNDTRAETNLVIIQQSAAAPTVGMEGQLEVALPLPGLETRPGDHRAPMIVRVASTQPYGTLTRYDLRYIGRVPGRHDLRTHLFAADGTPATNLPPLEVTVTGLLADPHNGWLEEQARRAPSLFGGYKAVLIVIGVLWIAAFFVIRRVGKKPPVRTAAPPVVRPPSFAEKIRPFIERAAAGQLSVEQKAELERLLITHWQRRLHLTQSDAGEIITQLRRHPEAGELLRALEDWLHRPPGRGTVDVEKLLAPYKNADEPVVNA